MRIFLPNPVNHGELDVPALGRLVSQLSLILTEMSDTIAVLQGLQSRVQVTIGPWSAVGTPAGSDTPAELSTSGGPTPQLIVADNLGTIAGALVISDDPRTAGTLSVVVSIDGDDFVLGEALNATTPGAGTILAPPDVAVPFAPGNEIGVILRTDAGWLPIAANVSVWLVVNMEQIQP